MPARPFWTPITRDVVTVEGPDALSYLHGQISQDIRNLGVGESTYTFVLEPTGKIDVLTRVTRAADDAFRLDVEAGFGEALLTRIDRFKIRVKAASELRSGVPVVALRGVDTAPADAVPAWGRADAFDVFGGDPPTEVPRGDDGDLHRERIVAGWPAMGAEITETTIPAETGIAQHAVSFTKGCYPGQELVERMDSRGASAPRMVRRLRGAGHVEAVASVRHDGAPVGTVTSVAEDGPGRWIALAPIARSVQPGTDVDVDGADGSVTVEEV